MMNTRFPRISPLLAALAMAAFVGACGGGGGGATTAAPGGGTSTPPAGGGTTTPPAGGDTTSGMRDLTSLQLSKLMSPGWNLGNTLDSIPNETAWGNPLATQALINAVKAAGFKTVRIPVTWTPHVDANDNIDPVWMARVTEVVRYASSAGLYAIVNVHHEGGWLNNVTYAQQPANNARLTKLWTQIANNFKDSDDHVLFAAINEVGKENAPWGVPPQKEWTDVQNGYNQVFVNAVRATGGNNAKRHLIAQAYQTNIDIADASAVLPTDTVANRLFFEVHFYDPWNLAGNDQSSIWQWGSIATDPSATETWANEAYVDAQFQKMKTRFVDKGVPVLMGEYGVIQKSEYDPAGTYRTYWTKYVTKSAVQHGVVPVWWDPGYGFNHATGLFNRATGAPYFPELVSAIVDNAK